MLLTFSQLTNAKCKEIQDFPLLFCGLTGWDGPDADPEPSIKSLESFPSVALHSAHHKPTMECYGKFMGELAIKY